MNSKLTRFKYKLFPLNSDTLLINNSSQLIKPELNRNFECYYWIVVNPLLN